MVWIDGYRGIIARFNRVRDQPHATFPVKGERGRNSCAREHRFGWPA